MQNLFISHHPLIRHKVTLLRDVNTEPKQFRELVRELAILLAYEATQDLSLSDQAVTTPMGAAQGHKLQQKIGLVPILRAGLGMVEGIWEMMPHAEVWHMGFYRDERTLKPVAYYNRLPIGDRAGVSGARSDAGDRRQRGGDRGHSQAMGRDAH